MKNWEIVRAWEEGKKIEFRIKKSASKEKWDDHKPCETFFDFEVFEYRLKSEQVIDWSNVAADTPVICINSDGQKFKNYFARPNGAGYGVFVYSNGATSRTGNGLTLWHDVKLDISAPSIINWIENTGIAPDCEIICAERRIDNNKTRLTHPCSPDCFNFDLNYINPIIRYFIIK
jgi:hypothetical protein